MNLQADVEPLVELSFAAAQGYASCKAELDALASSSYPQDAAPQQLRCMEQQLVQRLQVRHWQSSCKTWMGKQ
jgi:hypothetical protein